jgi:threonine/homoserine/homoserine lactone efflux protein
MSDLPLYFTSMGFGLAVAAPVGPMALLCMRRTLVRGWIHGLATGAGIAVADGTYAAIAALGLASISSFVLAHEQPLHVAAGLFLLYLGLKTFIPRKTTEDTDTSARLLVAWPAAFGSALLLTLTNPPTIVMFAAIFTALAPKSGFDTVSALVTVAGVFSGSLLWWCGVTAAVSAFRHAIGGKARRWIDRVAGLVLVVFGVAELKKAI